MTDIDTFRAALKAPPPTELGTLDIGGIMAAGGKLRRRRRMTATGLTVAAVLLGAGTVSVLVDRTPATPPAQTAASSTPGPDASDRPLGDVIVSTLEAQGGVWAFWAVPVDLPDLPDTHFGIMAGRKLADGRLASAVVANEVEGSDRAPGFRTTQSQTKLDIGTVPSFGYYVGPATRITAGFGKQEVVADQAVWSEDPSVVVFWFDPDDVPGNGSPTALNAYDRNGGKLPQ
jgi:hypothetical protein